MFWLCFTLWVVGISLALAAVFFLPGKFLEWAIIDRPWEEHVIKAIIFIGVALVVVGVVGLAYQMAQKYCFGG
jgi:hypothetical protein